jgi:GNAT superfamily N-acetyltransferase
MKVVAGPQSTTAQREELEKIAAGLECILADEHTFWPDVTTLYVTPDYQDCGIAVALVDVIADAFGVTPTMINV